MLPRFVSVPQQAAEHRCHGAGQESLLLDIQLLTSTQLLSCRWEQREPKSAAEESLHLSAHPAQGSHRPQHTSLREFIGLCTYTCGMQRGTHIFGAFMVALLGDFASWPLEWAAGTGGMINRGEAKVEELIIQIVVVRLIGFLGLGGTAGRALALEACVAATLLWAIGQLGFLVLVFLLWGGGVPLVGWALGTG